MKNDNIKRKVIMSPFPRGKSLVDRLLLEDFVKHKHIFKPPEIELMIVDDPCIRNKEKE